MALLMDRRYNPFRDFEDINRAFFGDNSLAEFKTDIRDVGDGFVLEADLPGFKKEDIKLSLNGDTLTIKAERHSDFEDQDKKSGYLRCERSYGSYSRSFDVTGVDVSQISASYNDGVLRIRLPKQAPKQPDARTIVIE
ncbi:Hsp20/alpha crystallin family protein [Subdoligranulum sp. DSM 109015]|uniref:Hsp20/alpha crystallin family protein n=1 Tax=Gemmiger gallinarum TaxID=2779354 RepID=A0ABR9R5R4_9FIRM|nr:Hsp20/alpha crystallin family protein [Gemmiger gallinarum]MBE5038493.1 Hsp20/alpha crystallin family protein [Gemmiger gallinarum]